MCGIGGIIRFNQPVEIAELENMTSVLAHRGPDGHGIWSENGIGLGHRRLSIIDLDTGKQPMCNEDETVWITYNGEIYNFLELQEELKLKGHHFRTRSDTEVIIHSYEEWGDDCVNHLRGMFAFGMLDKKENRLLLARDHLGIKPLFYYISPDCFAFSSEIQALRTLYGISFDLDIQAIDQYLWLQYIPAPRSVYQQIQKLPPAHRMSITLNGKIHGPEEYWRIEFHPDRVKKESEWLEELEFVFRDSVKAHLVSDVPFGAFLSGGVDSSTIVASMAQMLDKPVKTFSIGFEEENYNELKYAEVVAKRWRTDHFYEIVKPDAMEILPKLVKHYGEPFGDSSAIPTYYVSRLARRHVPMVLSGDGGDETFAGYHSYIEWMRYMHESPANISTLSGKCHHPLARKLFPWRYSRILHHDVSLEKWLTIVNYIPINLRMRLWRKEYRSTAIEPLDIFEKEFHRTKYFDNANKVQYMDLKTYLPYDILTKVDIASMMNGLEVRTPIVDKKVIEFAVTIPEDLNIRRTADGKWHGKLLFKKFAAKYYPSDFLNREKRGFEVPIKRWFSQNGSLHHTIRERLTGPNSMIFEYFEPKIIGQIIRRNYTGPMWLLLFLEEWLRQQNMNMK